MDDTAPGDASPIAAPGDAPPDCVDLAASDCENAIAQSQQHPENAFVASPPYAHAYFKDQQASLVKQVNATDAFLASLEDLLAASSKLPTFSKASKVPDQSAPLSAPLEAEEPQEPEPPVIMTPRKPRATFAEPQRMLSRKTSIISFGFCEPPTTGGPNSTSFTDQGRRGRRLSVATSISSADASPQPPPAYTQSGRRASFTIADRSATFRQPSQRRASTLSFALSNAAEKELAAYGGDDDNVGTAVEDCAAGPSSGRLVRRGSGAATGEPLPPTYPAPPEIPRSAKDSWMAAAASAGSVSFLGRSHRFADSINNIPRAPSGQLAASKGNNNLISRNDNLAPMPQTCFPGGISSKRRSISVDAGPTVNYFGDQYFEQLPGSSMSFISCDDAGMGQSPFTSCPSSATNVRAAYSGVIQHKALSNSATFFGNGGPPAATLALRTSSRTMEKVANEQPSRRSSLDARVDARMANEQPSRRSSLDAPRAPPANTLQQDARLPLSASRTSFQSSAGAPVQQLATAGPDYVKPPISFKAPESVAGGVLSTLKAPESVAGGVLTKLSKAFRGLAGK